MSNPRKPVLLVIRDGWGKNPHPDQNATNAVALAKKPCDDMLHAKYPFALVAASGLDVGLPHGVMGNSEVGHENIGAGRIVDQELVRLNKLFDEKRLATNPVWKAAVARVKANPHAKLHLMGIVSDAGVHGMLEHLYGILRQAKEDGITQVFIHAFTDGRDTPPSSGLGYIKQVEEQCAKIGVGKIATVCGRFWVMDRDNRWDRVSKAYYMLAGQKAIATAPNATAAIQQYYDKPLTATQIGDEFVAPTWIVAADGKPLATFANGDSVLFYNYRGDRPREITKAFVLDGFKEFDRGQKLDLYYATMTEYESGLPVHVVSGKPEKLKNILGKVVSDAGIPQFRCAETEKNPHVTFFFNNYNKDPFPGEDRACPASPKVAILAKNEAILFESQASDQWAYYQAKGVKESLAANQALLVGATNTSLAAKFDTEAARYRAEQGEIQAKARELEAKVKESNERAESLLEHHHRFAIAVTLFQIAIALSAIAALTKRKMLWSVGLAASVAAVVFFLRGFAG